MCSKISPPRLKPTATTTAATDTVINKETTTATAVKMKPRLGRKTRIKTRKRKYLSLLLELSPENTPHSSHLMTTTTTSTTDNHRNHHQLNLFPLYPDNLMEEKLETHEDNMAANFFPTTDGGAATLTGLLSATGTSPSTSELAEDATLSPSSMNYEEGELVKTAMRNKERDASEEKWVCYSEVVEKKEEEVSSSGGGGGAAAEMRRSKKMKGLSLKLDYNKIMNAWSDKGPLYIHTEAPPQTVPDLHDDDFLSSSSAAVNGLWSVPEMSETSVDGKLELSKTSIREASVQRYKEKRRSRLFAKKIRYQVRKLNAEKRPRIKGRFVKRS